MRRRGVHAQLLELQPELRAVGGWRGPLAVQRSSPSYYLAHRIVDVAVVWAAEVRAAADVPADAWLRPEKAQGAETYGPLGTVSLEMMLGEKDEGAQARAVAALADTCQRVLAAQPTLVHVPSPAKLFGDVHGQLRDLLLLFSYYGFPTHKGGDVQAREARGSIARGEPLRVRQSLCAWHAT